MPDISCVIVSYNNLNFLERAVNSVLEQTHPVDEIIIADDGSTDGSRELIVSLAYREGNIRPIFRERNIGVAANRDLAIRSSTCELITTLDGDDYYFPSKIENEFRALRDYGDAVAFSDVVLVGLDGCRIKKLNLSSIPKLTHQKRLRYLANRSGYIPRDMLMSKHLYLKAGGFKHDLRIYEDWDFKIRLAALPTNWVYSGTEGIAYRQTGRGLSSASHFIHLRSQYKVIRLNKKIILEKLGIVYYIESLLRLLYNWIKAVVLKVYRKLKN